MWEDLHSPCLTSIFLLVLMRRFSISSLSCRSFKVRDFSDFGAWYTTSCSSNCVHDNWLQIIANLPLQLRSTSFRVMLGRNSNQLALYLRRQPIIIIRPIQLWPNDFLLTFLFQALQIAQTTNIPTNQPNNKPTNQPINQPFAQSINQLKYKPSS